jgi:hypothetical protein
MKKRNKPIFLATFLVVMITGAIGYNIVQSGALAQLASSRDDGHGHGEEEPVAQPRDVDRSGVAAQVADRMKEAKDPGSELKSLKERLGGASSRPTILKPRAQAFTPVPNETSTAAHWYADESGIEKTHGGN